MSAERDTHIAFIKERGVDLELLKVSEQQWLETGDMFFVLRALAECAQYDTVIPEWAAKAYLRAFYKITTRRAASWDDVFGRPLKKRTKLAVARYHRELQPKVYLAITKILDENPETPIDNFLFEEVGKQFNPTIGKTLVGKLWANNFLRPSKRQRTPR